MTKSLMLDIETLSTKSDAAVISIGIAQFDDSDVINTQGWAIRPEDWSGHIDPNTVMWWMKQEQAAKTFSFGGHERAAGALGELVHWFIGCDELWANDPDFDVTILRNWWERFSNIRFPVSHRAMRSCRTITALSGNIDVADCYAGITAHNPVEDAACQARAVIKMRKVLYANKNI